MFSRLIQFFKNLFQYIRSIVFYIIFGLWTAFFSIYVVIYALVVRSKFNHKITIKPWALVTIYLAKFIAGISWEIKGKHNIPKYNCVILSNHQSTWETFFYQALFSPLTTVVKKELLRIPFFGQALSASRPIAINRSNPKEALKQLKTQGSNALQRNNWILLFPEGSRAKPGNLKKFSRGGASLAKSNNTLILPVAHNAGDFWLNNSWLKRSGKVTIEILPAIPTENKTTEELTTLVEQTIKEALFKTH